MPAEPDPVPNLRGASTDELVRAGEESLREHLTAQAVVAHQKYGPLSLGKLDAFLNDPACLRHPTRLVFEIGEMALHQFAQPERDFRHPDRDARVLYLRPQLQGRPELIIPAVAYMVPVINYGDIINDEHCLLYGATLLGLLREEFYRQVCAVADFVGAEPRFL